MQQRIPIKHFPTHPLALEAKEKLVIKNPSINYQIRRFHDGFNLVRRVSVNEISAQQSTKVGNQYTKRRKPKRTGVKA